MNNVYVSFEVLEKMQALGMNASQEVKEIAELVDHDLTNYQECQDVITLQSKYGSITIEIEVVLNEDDEIERLVLK